MELVVQPADGAGVPRRGRQRVSVSGVQRSTGERFGVRLEPRQRRRHHVSRMASGRRRRVRVRGARSAEPRDYLRRPYADAHRSPDRPGAEHLAAAGRTRQHPHAADRTGPLFPRRSARALFRRQHAVEDVDRRPQLDANQPGSLTEDVRDSRQHRQVPQRTDGAADRARRHLCGGAVAARHQPHLGRHRRWIDSRDDRWRRALGRRHPLRSEAVREGVDHRRRAFQRARRVRGDQHAAPRRPAAAHLPHARRRQDVDAHHDRHPRRRHDQRRPRGSEEEGTALRR